MLTGARHFCIKGVIIYSSSTTKEILLFHRGFDADIDNLCIYSEINGRDDLAAD